MNTTLDQSTENFQQQTPSRPEFLKVLCILSFVACGLWILVFALMAAFSFAMDETSMTEMWDQVVEKNPQLENVNAVEFLHALGLFSLYSLLFNIVSLAGVVMMWRLERIGFFIYAVAELGWNFIKLNVNFEGQEQSVGSLIFAILIDALFIGLYFANLKHMKGRNINSETSGI